MNPNKGIFGWFIFALAVYGFIWWMAGSYISLPVVAKDIDGNCVYIEYQNGSRHYGCGDSLPVKHHSIVVAGR